MDGSRFDALARTLSIPDTRRQLLGMLAALPVLGGILGFRAPEEAAAKDRRRRRKQRHKKKKGKHGTRRQGCKPKGKGKVCAGQCGPVKSKQTCGITVDCGPCDCPAACEACFVCDPSTRTCVADPEQEGDACGSPGQVCASDGSCACTAASCPACQLCGGDGVCTGCSGCCDGATCVADCPACTICDEGLCIACPGCCDGSGGCQDGETAAACGAGGGTCDVCVNPAPICVSHACEACTSDDQCGSGAVCCIGSCESGICCADADCAEPGAPDCVSHTCVCSSNGDAACPGSETCCNDGCADLQTDPDQCGACGNPCAEGQSCQGGVCGVVCGSDFCPSANAICVDGSCQTCSVTCTGSAAACGTALQTALDGSETTLYVCPGTYRGGFSIGRTVTVIGAGEGEDPATNTILDGNNTQRVLELSSGTVGLQRLRFTRGNVGSGNGGGIASTGAVLTLQDCAMANNRGNTGGGIYTSATLTLTGTTRIVGNTATEGGGIYSSGTLTLTGTTRIEGNTAGRGGGIFVVAGFPVTIGENCRVSGNTATDGPGSGGGIYGGVVSLLGSATPSPIVTGNCHENCAGSFVPNCEPGGTCPAVP
jgi:predicted outer membrane repeat protein